MQTAVKKFQQANGLQVDGIAGSATQHKLFGTVEPDSNTGNLEMTLYAAEKIDWYTGGIQQLWPKGANFKVYDVRTGIVWWAHRWSGGNHVDAEPLTAADTARLCKIYGVKTADEIASKDIVAASAQSGNDRYAHLCVLALRRAAQLSRGRHDLHEQLQGSVVHPLYEQQDAYEQQSGQLPRTGD